MTRAHERHGARRLVVATYNVHGCVGRDGVHDRDRIAGIVRRLSADVVCLQEVPFDRERGHARPRALWVARACGMRAVEGLTLRRRDGASLGNVLLTSAAVLRVDRVVLARPGREPRGAIDATVRAGRPGVEIRVVATHLGLSARERLHQARALVRHVGSVPDDGVPRILAGDLNVWTPRSRVLALLEQTFGSGPRRRTFPASRPLLGLDRVLASPPAAVVDARAVDDEWTRVASDHLPLRAAIAVPDPQRDAASPPGAHASTNAKTRAGS